MSWGQAVRLSDLGQVELQAALRADGVSARIGQALYRTDLERALARWRNLEVVHLAADRLGVPLVSLRRWLVAHGHDSAPGLGARWRLPREVLEKGAEAVTLEAAGRVGTESPIQAAARHRLPREVLYRWLREAGRATTPDARLVPSEVDTVVAERFARMAPHARATLERRTGATAAVREEAAAHEALLDRWCDGDVMRDEPVEPGARPGALARFLRGDRAR